MRPRLIRWTITAATATIAALFSANVEKAAEALGWDQALVWLVKGNRVPALIPAIELQPWMASLGLAIMAFTLGMWVDAWLVRSERARDRLRDAVWRSRLGGRMEALARECQRATKEWPLESFPRLRSEVLAVYLTLEEVGFVVPHRQAQANPDEFLRDAAHFLETVAPLLRRGHIEAARNEAISLSRF